MSPDEFRVIVAKIRPFTDYVYLHVLGEPLLHPFFEEILSIAGDVNLNVNITTNGGLIARKKEILLRQAVRQVNISLHDAEENIPSGKWGEYLDSIFDYALVAADKTYINLRLWNWGVETSSEFNRFVWKKLPKNLIKSWRGVLKGKIRALNSPIIFSCNMRLVSNGPTVKRNAPKRPKHVMRFAIRLLFWLMARWFPVVWMQMEQWR